MIKMTAIGFLNGVERIEADRWYFRYHSRECVRYFGPWLRRYESFRAYASPEDAEPWNPLGGRLTELWWDSVASFEECQPFGWPYTAQPPEWASLAPQGKGVIVPAMPTEDFLGKHPMPGTESVLRWVWVFRYPKGVDVEEGEEWYTQVHAKEMCQQEDLLRFVSHRAIEPPLLPGSVRVSELWYRDMDAWRRANVESPPNLTPPFWTGEAPFLDLQTTFVADRPDVDFLGESRLIP